jgi:hypothetical protein
LVKEDAEKPEEEEQPEEPLDGGPMPDPDADRELAPELFAENGEDAEIIARDREVQLQ